MRAGAHGFHQVACHAGEFEQAGHFHFRQRADDFVHVAAGAEIAARAGDHHRLHVVDVIQRTEGIAQLGIRFKRQRVLALGTVERDSGNFAAHFPFEMLRFEIGGFGHSGILRNKL